MDNGGPTEADFVSLLTGDGRAYTDANSIVEAAICFQLVLDYEPTSVAALSGLGKCELRAGFPRTALGHLQQAARQSPERADLLALTAEALERLGRLDEAKAELERAIGLEPDEPRWRRQLLSLGRRVSPSAETLERARAMTARFPGDWQAWAAHGTYALHALRNDEAESCFRRALALAPDQTEPHRGIADVMFLRGQAEQALNWLARAAEVGKLPPRSVLPCPVPGRDDGALSKPEVLGCLVGRLRELLAAAPGASRLRQALAHGLVLQGDLGGALAVLSALLVEFPGDGAVGLDLTLTALACDPAADCAAGLPPLDPALINKALVPLLIQTRRAPQPDLGLDFAARRRLLALLLKAPAMAGMRGLRHRVEQSAAANPAGWWVGSFLAYLAGDAAEGRRAGLCWMEATLPAIEADPAAFRLAFDQLWALVAMLERQGRPDEARALCDRFLDAPAVLRTVILSLFSLADGQITLAEPLLAAVFAQGPRLPELQADDAGVDRIWEKAVLAAAFLSGEDAEYDAVCALALDHYRRPASEPLVTTVPAAPRDGRLRLGYVMSDFNHQDMPPEQYALTFHDSRRFAVSVYYFTPASAAHVRPDRAAPPTLTGWSGTLRNINDMDADRCARLIAGDGIEVLVDSVGWWASEIPRLFVQRPAPVQVSWLGLGRPGKAGIMDYIIGNEDLFPRDFDARYPERFIRLAGSYIPPKPVSLTLPAMPRRLLGLPEDAFIYLGYHQLMKITRRSLKLWFKIIQRTPGSLLVLPRLDPCVLAELAAEAGVGLDRVVMFPWVRSELENITRIGAADVYLDTLPFNSAGLTGYDAIAMNVPRITLSSSNLYSMFGKILQNALGLGELVCRTEAEYIALAVDLYENRDRLRAIKQRMTDAGLTSKAMRPEPLMRQIEAAMIRVRDIYQCGREPEGFDVPEIGSVP